MHAQADRGPSVVAAPGPSWRDRWLSARDRLLASPRFQHWAAAFPLTRPIAQRRARALFDLCAGFVYAQVLLACVQLRLFDILAEGPQTGPVLAGRLGLSAEAAQRLLLAAVSLELVEHRGRGRFGLGQLGAAFLGNPGVAAMVEHHTLLYGDLRDPVALLRGDRQGTDLGRYWAYASSGRPAALAGEQVAAYSALMSASQPLVAGDILDAYPLERHRCLLDIGGGEGAFLAAAAARAPELRLMLFDLPPVVERARVRLSANGLAGRTAVFGGDFSADPLPQGADVVSLVRVAHDHDDASVLALLQAARRALPDDGVLLLAEPMSGTAGALPIGDAYFGFYLLAMGSGRPRTPDELRAMLGASGFSRVRLAPTRRPLLTRLLVARP